MIHELHIIVDTPIIACTIIYKLVYLVPMMVSLALIDRVEPLTLYQTLSQAQTHTGIISPLQQERIHIKGSTMKIDLYFYCIRTERTENTQMRVSKPREI